MSSLRHWPLMALIAIVAISCDPAQESADPDSVSAAPSGTPLLLAVHPYDNPSELVARFQPLADYLSRCLDRPVELYLGHSYGDTIRRISAGQVDLAYLGPTLYLRAHDHYLGPNASPTIRILAGETVDGALGYTSVLVTLRSSPIKTVADLRDRTLAFVEHGSFSGHFVPRAMLDQAGITLADLMDYAFLDRHERVALAVVHGDFAAGGLRKEVADRYLDRGLKIIAESTQLSPHVIAARPGLDDALAEIVTRALIDPGPDAQPAFAALGPGIGFAHVEDSAFDPVRRAVYAIESAQPVVDKPW